MGCEAPRVIERMVVGCLHSSDDWKGGWRKRGLEGVPGDEGHVFRGKQRTSVSPEVRSEDDFTDSTGPPHYQTDIVLGDERWVDRGQTDVRTGVVV